MLLFAVSVALGGAICRDGSTSDSTGSGTCSHHGGVATWTGSSPSYVPPVYVRPTDVERAAARAICADGWVSYSRTPSGTCAGHGGVSTWLDGLAHADRDDGGYVQGYVDTSVRPGNAASPAKATANAYFVGDEWYCNKAYKKVGGACVSINPPPNSYAVGDEWYCNKA